jgi:hypothetical protein
MMSDSVFSLVILVYVSTAFCIVFFLFCWNTKADQPGQRRGPQTTKRRCPLDKGNPKLAAQQEHNMLLESNVRLNKSTMTSGKDSRDCHEMKKVSV